MPKIASRLLWKFFSIQRKELRFVIPLFFLYLLSGSFYAVGQIYTETLFLKAYGAHGLSRFFVYNGLALIIAGIMYNYVLLRVSLQRGYLFLIALFSALIYISQYISFESHPKVPFYLYLGNYLFTFYLDVHYFNYSSQFLSIQSAKRLLPLLMGGGKLGGIIASFFLIALFGQDVVFFGSTWWFLNGVLLVFPILWIGALYQGRERKFSLEKNELLPDVHLFEKIIKRIELSFSAPIFYVSILVVFVMALVNTVAEYHFAAIFNRVFTSKNDLALFLSMYTFIADLVTLFIQLFIASRLIRFLGVKKSNYIYPTAFLAFFAYMIVYPGLLAGILLRFFRKSMSVIFRQPVFNIIFAASPRHRMAEMKSFISGIILPAGMIAGGGMILIIYKKLSTIEGYIFTGLLALAYVALTALQNRAYVLSLKKQLFFDTATKVEIPTMIDYTDFQKDVRNVDINLVILEAIFRASPNAELLSILEPHFSKLGIEAKEKMLEFTAFAHTQFREKIIRSAVCSKEPQVRALALRAIRNYPYAKRVELLQGYPSDRLESEQLALEILLVDERQAHGDSDIEASSFAISLLSGNGKPGKKPAVDSRIAFLKSKIIQGFADPIEFYVLAQVVESSPFAHMLAELALSTKDVRLFKALVAHAHFLPRKIARKLMCAFAHVPFRLLSNFIALSTFLKDVDRAMLLNRRYNFTLEEIEEVYANGDFFLRAVIKRIFRKYDYARLSNYFKYLISTGVRVNEEMFQFIAHQNRLVGNSLLLRRLIRSKSFANKADALCADFLNFVLKREVELRKHLILKAVSVVTGTEIDYAYESSIFLKDGEITEYIREFMEAMGKVFKDSVYIFEEEVLEVQSRIPVMVSECPFDVGEALLRTCEILPGMKEIVGFASARVIRYFECRADIEDRFRKYLKMEEHKMLNVLGKIIFLKGNDLFCDIGIDELVRIAHIAKEIEFPAGKVFIRENDIGEDLYIIIEGEVDVIKGKKVIETLSDGSCIGELSIIDREPRSASVKTKKRTRFLMINRKDFLLTVKENPEIAIGVMKIIAQRFRRVIAK
ncbi:MAG: cyclic nucleotide-binding domain-containing protein [Spirochaetes bacterium]|nr:cyclic nucleotide-binding domain-containing protein [Spirochaetota bacterium]